MDDLFTSTTGNRIDIPEADIVLYAHALNSDDATVAFNALLKQIQWLDLSVTVWGKTHPQPRRIAWHGDAGTRYGYSGSRVEPLPWTPLLSKLRHRVQTITGMEYNSVLLNLYRDGNDNLGMHSDNEPELGPEPVIASLSLGQSRDFQLRHKTRKELKTMHITLSHGSLLVMRGATQANWKHGLRRETRQLGPRINLTFRKVMPRKMR